MNLHPPLLSYNLVQIFHLFQKQMRSYSSYQKYRKWQKVVEPLVKYNRTNYDMGYPLPFFNELQQKIEMDHPLNLNIATTLTGRKDNCIKTVFEDNQQIGKVTFVPSILKFSFDAEIQKQMQERLNKFSERDAQFETFYNSLKETNTCDQFFPLAVLKQKQQNGESSVRTLNRDEFKKLSNLQPQQIAQCFIFGSGKQTSTIRFFYNPSKQKSQAFKIDNLQGFMKRRFGKNQFKIRQQVENSLTFVKIMYTNKSFYKQCLNLVQFLQKHKKIKIDKIVTDWILDPHNRYYLIDVKEISYTHSQVIPRNIRTLTDKLAFLTCKVCQQKFRQQEITKVLTDKLIRQCFEHLKKRQVNISFNFSMKPTDVTSKVCEVCYMLVVSESQLIELQKKVALVTHSITSSNARSSTILTGPKGKMFEWRLFLYLEDIRNLQIQNLDKNATYYIMIKIQNTIASFKIKNITQKYHLIKGIKIYYFFSQQQKIDQFLINSEISIRITKGNNWNSVVAEGNTYGLYQESEKHSMRKFKQILVFNQKSEYSVVGIHIGVKMEGKYDPSHLALHKTHDVYMVENGYSNCYALHAEWMETIDPSYCVSKAESTTFSYSLHLGQSERKALLPSLLPKTKKKLIL